MQSSEDVNEAREHPLGCLTHGLRDPQRVDGTLEGALSGQQGTHKKRTVMNLREVQMCGVGKPLQSSRSTHEALHSTCANVWRKRRVSLRAQQPKLTNVSVTPRTCNAKPQLDAIIAAATEGSSYRWTRHGAATAEQSCLCRCGGWK